MNDLDTFHKYTCVAHSVENFNEAFSHSYNSAFSVLHLNIRSLNKNFEQLRLFCEDALTITFKVIALSETWKISNSSYFNIPNYQLVTNCRQNGVQGGGVAMYVHDSLNFEVIGGIEIPNTESLWIEFLLNSGKFSFGVLYRKPDTNIDDFNSALLHHL